MADKRKEDDDYDPFAERDMKNALTNWEAKISVLKCALGTGCLAMPMAFKNSGYLNGLISTLIIGVIVIYALQILIMSMRKLCKRKKVPQLSFSESMEVALKEGPPMLKWLSKPAGICTTVFLSLYHFGICSVYVVFISETMKKLMDYYVVVIDVRLYMVMILIPLILIFAIRDIKHLVPFSFCANIILILGYLFIIVVIFINLPNLGERVAFASFHSYPLFLGTVLFALESVGVIIAIEAKMQKPESYLGLFGVLNQGMFVVVLIYILMGFFGYWRYGDQVEGTITLNMPQEILYEIVKLLFALAVYLSYPLQGYVTVDVIWNQNVAKKVAEERRTVLEFVVRASIVLASVICAILVPEFDMFLSLVGSFCLSILGVIFPALIDMCTRYEEGYGKFKVHLIVGILMFVFGVLGGVAGTYCSIANIVRYYMK